MWVGTSTEPLELLEVKAQGKKAMRAADWARGATSITPSASKIFVSTVTVCEYCGVRDIGRHALTTRSGPLRPSLYGLTTHAAHRSLVGAEKLFEIIEVFANHVRSAGAGILLHFRFGAERHAKTGRMNHRQIVRAVANRNSLRHIDAHPRGPRAQRFQLRIAS